VLNMRYEMLEDKVTFYMENAKSDEEFTQSVSLRGILVNKITLQIYFGAICKQFKSNAVKTQKGAVICFIGSFISFFRSLGLELPSSYIDWQKVITLYFRFYLLDKNFSKSSAKTRISEWTSRIKSIFEYWVDEEIIPYGVIIPGAESRKIIGDSQRRKLLGGEKTEIISTNSILKKSFLDTDFSLTESIHLNKIEKNCQNKINLITNVCFEHWSALKGDYKTGCELSKKITSNEIERRLLNDLVTFQSGKNNIHTLLASPRNKDGHVWAIAVAKYCLKNGNDSGCVSVKRLCSSPFFVGDTFDDYLDYYGQLKNITNLREEAFNKLSSSRRFYRFIGLLSPVDVAALCCLLTIENPKFTSESLQNAKLLDVNGKSYVIMSDSSVNSIFSVDKPRAGKRKISVLPELSEQIFKFLIEVTSPLREIMKRNNIKGWRFLFLGWQRGGYFGPIKGDLVASLTHNSNVNLIGLYPELKENGLGKKQLDFSRIRNTMGILRWFKTGSIVEMTKVLGNSYKVVLEHYIPPEILRVWNTRIIRRFQNTLIILSSKDEEYLLDVSDFNNIGDLNYFIAQVVYEHRNGSGPVGERVFKELSSRFLINSCDSDMSKNMTHDSILNIRLSYQSIGVLYAFSEYFQKISRSRIWKESSEFDKVNAGKFYDLARMIKYACESDNIDNPLRELVDVEQLRRFHDKAVLFKGSVLSKFDNLIVKNEWCVYE